MTNGSQKKSNVDSPLQTMVLSKRVYKISLMFTLALLCALMLSTTAFAAGTDIWTWADTTMKDVYGKIVAISTTVACCMAAVSLLVMNFSSSGKAVDEARSWFKRILVTWAIINVLGFVMAYLKPLVNGGSVIP